jgi:hypothetical protein
MSKSILQQDDDVCFLCGGYGATEWHHIFGGANRKKSEHYGLKVRLHHDCHNEPPEGVHFNKDKMQYLHEEGQKAAMKRYGWSKDEFRQMFSKNYL